MATLSIPITPDQRAPQFSVVLCTYNRADLLPRALESLLKQTICDWEAIVVDDGSRDDTPAVVREFMRRTPQVRYLAHSNRGVALSRNAGALAATGEWLTFLDSDDFYLPWHLETRRHLLAQHPEVAFLHGGVHVIGDPFVADKEDPTRQIHLSECLIDATVFIRRQTFLSLGGLPPVQYAQANAFFQRVQAAGLPVLKTDLPTYVYDRTTPDSVCTIMGQGGLDALLAYRRGEGLPVTASATQV